ncbi:unnamed protein product [Polarella glacialis]|uniref:Uncharacterized protein n=1 Tax=Polarella glacialis TaxID=89957 RepID=A0A813FMR4_POLGL|nr:unnamed protein product [Polarella glacialis]
MIDTGIVPACAKDLEKYKGFAKLAGGREALYVGVVEETEKLKNLLAAPHKEHLADEANYLCEQLKPQMEAVRALVDRAEGLLEAGLYPFPTYEALLYSHHH